MKRTEKILVSLVVLSIIMKLLHIRSGSFMLVLSTQILAWVYLFGSIKIFKESGKGSDTYSILSGIAIAAILHGIMFKLLRLAVGNLILMISIVVLLFLAWMILRLKQNTVNSEDEALATHFQKLINRYLFFGFIGLLLLLAPMRWIPDPKPKHRSVKQESSNASQDPDSIKFDKHISVFKYTSTYADSSLVTEIWYQQDSIVQGKKFYHNLPFESEFVSSSILEQMQDKNELETFSEAMCEVGGTSAWNKYVVEFDYNKRPMKVKHYKAWWYEGLGDAPQPTKPKYFLGETVSFVYGANWSKQIAYDVKGVRIETIEKRYDKDNKLLYEHWDAWNNYRFKVFYSY